MFFLLFESINFFALGFFGCFLLRSHLDLNAVMASAFVGALGTLLPTLKYFDRQKVQQAIFAGSFAGMSSSRLLDSVNDFIFVAILGGGLFYLLRHKFFGVGGKSGTIAFIAVALLMLYRGLL